MSVSSPTPIASYVQTMAGLSPFADIPLLSTDQPQPETIILGHDQDGAFVYRTQEFLQLIGEVDQEWRNHLYPLTREIYQSNPNPKYADCAMRGILMLRATITVAWNRIERLPKGAIAAEMRADHTIQQIERSAREALSNLIKNLNVHSGLARSDIASRGKNHEIGDIYFNDDPHVIRMLNLHYYLNSKPTEPHTLNNALAEVFNFSPSLMLGKLSVGQVTSHPTFQRVTDLNNHILEIGRRLEGAPQLNAEHAELLFNYRRALIEFLLGTVPDQWADKAGGLVQDGIRIARQILATQSA